MSDDSSSATGLVLLIFGVFGLITGIVLSLTFFGILIGVPIVVLSVLMMAFGIAQLAGSGSPARAPQQYYQQPVAPQPYYPQAPQPVVAGPMTITVRAGGRHVSSLPMVAGGAYSIGRGSDNAVVLGDPGVSSRHALISVQSPGLVSIEDLGSTNGIFLNGSRISARTQLGSGSSVRLGANQVIDLSW